MITFVVLKLDKLPPKKVVITGGPGTGKTSVVQSLKNKGFTCFDEIIRDLTAAAKKEEQVRDHIANPLAFVRDPFDFNTRLLEGRMAQYHSGSEHQTTIVFYDRGIPDVLAYMNYFGQSYTDYFERACRELRYDEVILLPPWEEIYQVDAERMETYDEAVAIHGHLEGLYRDLGYGPLLVPKGSVMERTEFIMEVLNLYL